MARTGIVSWLRGRTLCLPSAVRHHWPTRSRVCPMSGGAAPASHRLPDPVTSFSCLRQSEAHLMPATADTKSASKRQCEADQHADADDDDDHRDIQRATIGVDDRHGDTNDRVDGTSWAKYRGTCAPRPPRAPPRGGVWRVRTSARFFEQRFGQPPRSATAARAGSSRTAPCRRATVS